MRNRFYQRWLVTLGMVAMLGALLSMPMTATYAFAMTGQSASMAADSLDTSMTSMSKDMDCAKPVHHCPNCPQKVCPEMGSCLVKCFQPLAAPISEARLSRDVIAERLVPLPVTVTAGSLIPPLLRPPSV